MGFSNKDTLKRGLSSRSQSTENRPEPAPSTSTSAPSTSTTTPVPVVEVQEEAKIEIHVTNEGEIEEVHIYEIPLKYLSTPYVNFRELMKRSGQDLNNISGGQQINISCKFELFERILKLAQRKELEAKYANSSYDDRLWKRK